MLITIKRRWDGKILHEIESTDLRTALEKLAATDAVLTGADLRGADLRGAVLTGAVLTDAVLTGADLTDAVLTDAVLTGADLTDAVLTGADLRGADLTGAVLTDAVLTDAVLRGAVLTGIRQIPTGETWEEYLTVVVPALLTAGGKPLESFGPHFECHTWENCPMAYAFDAPDLSGVPMLLRPRADQFIQFFDARQIPWPLPTKEPKA